MADIELTQSEAEAIHGVLHRLETKWVERPMEPDEYHCWDPLPFWLFLDRIRIAMEHARGIRFLDVGCGIGTKLALMHDLGYEVAGIELRAEYAEAAMVIVPEAEITYADALEIAKFDADIVYMYRPAKADDLEERLEEHVISRLTSGTVLFLPTRNDSPVCARLERLGIEVWRVP